MTEINYKGALVKAPLPGLDDAEDERVPPGIPTVIDAHVHLFPDWLFEPIWQWFDAFGWPVRYKLSAGKIRQPLAGYHHGCVRLPARDRTAAPGVFPG